MKNWVTREILWSFIQDSEGSLHKTKFIITELMRDSRMSRRQKADSR